MTTRIDPQLVEVAAADGTTLYDLVVALRSGDDRVIYRGVDRAHVEAVRSDIVAGRLDPVAVQAVFREVILVRSGRPQPMFVRGIPIPLSWGKGKAGDRWQEARRRIEALRAAA